MAPLMVPISGSKYRIIDKEAAGTNDTKTGIYLNTLAKAAAPHANMSEKPTRIVGCA